MMVRPEFGDKFRLVSIHIGESLSACASWCVGRNEEGVQWDPHNSPLVDYSIIGSIQTTPAIAWDPPHFVKAETVVEGVVDYCYRQDAAVIVIEEPATRLPLHDARIVHSTIALAHYAFAVRSMPIIYVPNWRWAAKMTGRINPTMTDVILTCVRRFAPSADPSSARIKVVSRAVGAAFGASAKQVETALSIYERTRRLEDSED